jgi:hypothetical protein
MSEFGHDFDDNMVDDDDDFYDDVDYVLDDFYVYDDDFDDFDDFLDDLVFGNDDDFDDYNDNNIDDFIDDDADYVFYSDTPITNTGTTVPAIPPGLKTREEYIQSLKDGTTLTLKEKLDNAQAKLAEKLAERAAVVPLGDHIKQERIANAQALANVRRYNYAANRPYFNQEEYAELQRIYRETQKALNDKTAEHNSLTNSLGNEINSLTYNANVLESMYNEFTALNPDYENLEISDQQKLQIDYEFKRRQKHKPKLID